MNKKLTDTAHLMIAELNMTLEHLYKYQSLHFERYGQECRHTKRGIHRVLRSIKTISDQFDIFAKGAK